MRINENVESFAKRIIKYNEKIKRLSNSMFVVSIMLAAILMVMFKASDEAAKDIFKTGNLTYLLLVFAVADFTRRFYEKYVTNGDLINGIELEEFINMHALPVEDYFRYISYKILPYQVILTLCFAAFSIMSDKKLICILTSIISILASFIAGILFKKYFISKISSRKSLWYVTIIVMIANIVEMIMIMLVSIAFAFLAMSISEALIEKPMADGEVIERIIGIPEFIIMIVGGFEAFVICYTYEDRLGTKSKFYNAIWATGLGIVAIGVLGMFLSARLWYYEINYTNKEITVTHFEEKKYDFSDVKKYEWKSDEDSDSVKTLVLYLNDGTVLDTNSDGCFESENGDDYEMQRECFPEK